MAKTTPLSSSTNRLVAQPATAVTSPTIEAHKSDLDPANARTGVLEPHLDDTFKGMHDLLDKILENAWQEMKQNLAAEDRLVLAQMPQGLDHSNSIDRWTWFGQCPGLIGARQVARRCVAREFKATNYQERWAALGAKYNALAEKGV